MVWGEVICGSYSRKFSVYLGGKIYWMQDAEEVSGEEEGSVERLLEWQRRSWYGMSEILPYLYLGGLRDANDVKQLKEKQVTIIFFFFYLL